MPGSDHNSELSRLKTNKEAFVYFLSKLDLEMAAPLLEEDHMYQDMPRYQFLQKLEHALDRFLRAGDTCLFIYNGTCTSQSCGFGCQGIRFVGNVSGLYMDLIIKEEAGKLHDVYECHAFSTVSPPKTLAQKVLIDTTGMPLWWLEGGEE